jgi:acetyltransferase-like isoleucine patch superfamily enzyme
MKPPIVSQHIRVRHPQHFSIGEGSIVDDYCYFSTKLQVGRYTHIANGCSIAGGGARQCIIGDYCSLSSGVKIWCTSNDFVNDIVVIAPEGLDVGAELISGDVTLENFTGVGTNSVIMPDNRIPEGTVIGALSFVPNAFDFKPWSVYAGVPLRFIKPRNQENVLKQVQKLDSFLHIERRHE